MNPSQCWICDQKIGRNLSAVGRSGDRLSYIPFIEELSAPSMLVAHPVCFAEEHGVEALVAVIHEHDFQLKDARDYEATGQRRTKSG